ncbi:MAG: hypothetical protein U0990_10535 [Candidatus Nanopelagicales bacterium]|nr:hypothetical protein [Candidatus Nanopelagicales bacterium]MDZ4250508.1 hypothetical protein [Candidatus Nanopelagicales bacterium]
MARVAVSATVVVASLLAASGCAVNRVTDPNPDVGFTPCTQVECSGELPSGSAFEIMMPQTWNGSLAIYSHGASADSDSAAASAGFLPAGRALGPAPAPLWSRGDKSIADVLLGAGYAIAGAAPGEGAWRVPAQIKSGEELYEYFSENIAVPNRVYVWGMSEGGLASVRLAELHPDWVSGGAALCAPTAGARPTFNLALDVAFAVKQLMYPRMKLTGYSSVEEAAAVRDAAIVRVRRAPLTPSGVAKVLFIGSLSGLPAESVTESGEDRSSQAAAYGEGIENLIAMSTVLRYDLERQVGGNPSSNSGTDYLSRISAAEQSVIDELRSGSVAALYDKLNAGQRIESEPDAEASAAELGGPSGDVAVPLIALHNAADPVYIAQHATSYADRAASHSAESRARLVNLFVVPPDGQSSVNPADEGAGHCVFKRRTVLGTMILLNDWARNGRYPQRDAIEKALPGAELAVNADVGAWPATGVVPTAQRSVP